MQSKDSEELEKINQQITALLTYRSGLIKEIKVIHKKRKDLRDEIRGLSKKIDEARDNLDELTNHSSFISFNILTISRFAQSIFPDV